MHLVIRSIVYDLATWSSQDLKSRWIVLCMRWLFIKTMALALTHDHCSSVRSVMKSSFMREWQLLKQNRISLKSNLPTRIRHCEIGMPVWTSNDSLFPLPLCFKNVQEKVESEGSIYDFHLISCCHHPGAYVFSVHERLSQNYRS